MAKTLKTICGENDKPLVINGIKIPCYVLENEKRVISHTGMLNALGMKGGSAGKGEGDRLTKFIAQDRFKELINNELMTMITSPIKFKTPSAGAMVHGYDATILVDICEAIIDANKKGLLQKQQQHIAENAETLIRAFAKVGIIALVDEATGYQHIREKNALRKILEAYISPHLLPWAERFPKEFYEEMFRLRGWPYDPTSVKRPGVVGKYTNTLVYEQLPDGVLEELKAKTPKTSTGLYAAQLHRSLTADTGHPHLDRQLTAVITLMKISTSWTKFMSHFAKAFNTGQQHLDLDDN